MLSQNCISVIGNKFKQFVLFSMCMGVVLLRKEGGEKLNVYTSAACWGSLPSVQPSCSFSVLDIASLSVHLRSLISPGLALCCLCHLSATVICED